MFFQVFDKGWMEDGEGRYIDFKNTVIILTSNVGSDLIANMCRDPDLAPTPEGLAQAVRQPLLQTFPAALLGRLTVVPYYPISDAMLEQIIRLQMLRIQRRIEERHGAQFSFDEAAVDLVRRRCSEVESGARMVDGILTRTCCRAWPPTSCRPPWEARNCKACTPAPAATTSRWTCAPALRARMSGRRLPRATTAVIAAALLAAPAAQALDLGAIGQAADTCSGPRAPPRPASRR